MASPYRRDYSERDFGRGDRVSETYEAKQRSKHPIDWSRGDGRYELQFPDLPADATRRSTKQPFDEAGRKLAECLEAGLAYFQQFLTAFNEEVRGIHRYVGQDLLDDIWVAKVRSSSKADRSSVHSSSAQAGVATSGPDNVAPVERLMDKGFQEFSKYLLKCFDQAVDADVRPRGDVLPERPDEKENAARAMKKLQTAYPDFEKMLRHSGKHYSRIPSLLKEIGFLLRILDDIGGVRRDGEIRGDGG